MDSSVKKHSSIKTMESLEEIDYMKDYTEAEAEEYLKLVDNKNANRKQSKFDLTFQGLEDNLQRLYVEDQVKVYQESDFTYKPKFNDLSILAMKNMITSIVETNSVVVIQGPTGCGKTTQIPQFILDANIKKLNCNIIVTQPRRIAAISIAKRVSQERRQPLGSVVGYIVGMRKEISPETCLTYCTTEVLLHHLIYRKHMLDYTHIVLDEIHERDQHLDFLLLVVKKLLRINSGQVKVILMSATIDVMKIAKYFSTRVGEKLVPAPIIKIPERRNFEIRTYYLDEIKNLGVIPEVSAIEPKINQSMINFCSHIIHALDEIDVNDDEGEFDSSQRHTVLVFLPGIYEIEELYNYLSSIHYKNKLWDLAILHSLISTDDQERIFHKPPIGYRRIILSTNIAESSITVPDVKYVIDFCLVKVLAVDPSTHYQSLQLCWTSKTNCMQRAGRAGRLMDGRVYRLVPKAFYDNIFDNEGIPEMLRAPLANVILRAKILDLDEPRALLSLSLDPPTLSNLENTILILKEAGALVNEDDTFQPFDGKLTDLGRLMAFLPLDIRISKLIMLGHVFGVLRDAIILGASMSLKNVFSITLCRPDVSSYAIRRKWARNSNSDCIAALNIYKIWQNEKANRRLITYQSEKQWAQRNGIQLKALRELDALVNDLTEKLLKFGIKESVGVNKVVWQESNHDFVLQVILAGAFYPNYFVKRLQNPEVYKKNITLLGALDPMKTVYLKGWPTNQPGYLYAKKFQEIFSKIQGVAESQIAVSFDASKRVYVQFCEKKTFIDESLHNISDFVYQGVKMRHCKTPIEIKLLNIKEANKRARHYDFRKYERTLIFHSGRLESYLPKNRPELPGLDVIFIPLFIKTIISPGYFWAIFDDEATHNKLQIIAKILNQQPLRELSSGSKISTIIAAPIEKNGSLTYHRVIIEEFISGIGELVDILFIDHGCSSRVRFSDLREIDDITVLEIPPLAFRCNLAFLRPSFRNNHYGQWSKVSNNYFWMQIKASKKIFGKIYSVVNSVVKLELFVVNEKKEKFNLNEALIEKGYAVRREESYSSKHNHELRTSIHNINTMSMEEKRFHEEEQYNKDYLLTYPDLPKEEDCDSNIKLQGPFSPLEIELVQLISIGKLKKATIETNSVNSVLLDIDPEDQCRLLIAQSVSEEPTNGQLILKNTTFLPNIPGLAAWLALSFAPRMELRCNSQQTYYTGALCGLGPTYDSAGQSMFPDHDMEIQFDVEITIDDVKEINKLRHWINVGMQLDKIADDEHIINCQNKIEHILLELRDRQRELRNPLNDEIDYISNKWNRYDKSYFLPSIRKTTNICDVYPLHNALELRAKDGELEEMLGNLSELQHLAYGDAEEAKNVIALCKLCGKQTLGLLELRYHLQSEQHMENEKTLLN